MKFSTHFSRKKQRRKEKSPEPTKVIVDLPSHPTDPVEMRRQHFQTPGNKDKQNGG